MLDFIKSLGYDVYIREPKQEYCFYTDGTHIGYAQWGGIEPRVCSVHKPSLSCGTGYSLFTKISKNTLDVAIKTIKPHHHARDEIKKFKDWDEFHNSSEWNKKLYKI